ncbi:phage tail protein [Pleomorphomonas diazotrophica]|uniref:Phage tail protein n=1 Tax=Pleomorphomonas diazotrophica TaxID=1166257 RepID=A0A1I4TH70_9HYPH|nr:siderophore-interacting protein [Pleomorphomonas diazotrophica]PKR87250.1 phage tail protein [Pleomorphomonas diazotrophica]SFM75983.1 NADPH-dependent ferric siderophore reductase, contains FAD-binding and SIP domains [Pleomorphomonas diazotrophica]
MTIQEPVRLAATLFVPSPDPAALRARLVEHVGRYAHSETTAAGDILLSSELGLSRLTLEAGGLRIAAESRDPAGLAYIKMIMADHVLEFGQAGVALHWTGAGGAGSPLPFFREMTVTAVAMVGRFLRLTLRGNDLGRFAEGGLHVRLLLPSEGVAQRWPVTGDDGRPFWPDGNPPPARVYTLRRIDVAAGEVEIDMLLHAGHHGAPGAAFAERARAGDVVGMTGPGGGDLPEAADYLFFADETGLPAVARMLAEMPAGRRVRAFVEVEDEADRQVLPSSAAAEITWLYRRDGARLELAAIAIGTGDLPPDFVVWGGMEHAARRAIYRRAIDTWNLSRDRLRLASYWRRGQAGEDHHHDD